MPYSVMGTTVQIGAVTLTGVQSISSPQASRGTIETTNLDSTVKVFIAGLIDGGELSVTVFTSSNLSGIVTLLGTGAASDCTITLPASNGTITFSGIVTKLGPEQAAAGDNASTTTIGVKVSGAVTYTFS